MIMIMIMCVYYCSTYYKAVRDKVCVCVLVVYFF
jgi:hypothetical protein